MKRLLQNTLLGLAISIILSCAVVSADTQTPKISEVEYKRYKWANNSDGQKYHYLLQTRLPKDLEYFTRMTATANINDTSEKETIVLITVDMKAPPYDRDCVQAFLIVADTESQTRLPKKKEIFKLFDAGTHALDVPAKTIELHSPRFVFTQPPKDTFESLNTSFKLVDLTGDGILDVWVKLGYAVVVISFQDGEFREIFSSYTVPESLSDPEYVDLNDDGSYEIKIPYSIQIAGVPGAPYLEWMSLYEWDGNTYVLNNERFYAENDEFLIRLLDGHNSVLNRYGRSEEYSFYIGLVFYYRGNAPRAREYLQWVVEHAKKQDYIQAAESLLKKLPRQ